MTAEQVVLDASALIASIYEENGADVVDSHLDHAVISTVNLAEVAAFMVRDGIPVAEVREHLTDLALAISDYDAEQAFESAGLSPKTTPKGLSFGDRACLALAKSRGLIALTADRVWKSLDIGVKIRLIR